MGRYHKKKEKKISNLGLETKEWEQDTQPGGDMHGKPKDHQVVKDKERQLVSSK